jgi:hypothetical protein
VYRLGLVSHNGKQVYFYEQGANYTPFPSTDHGDPTKFGPQAGSFVPAALLDKTNAQLFAQYGLASGGIVASADARQAAEVNGLEGAPATILNLPSLALRSAKNYNDSNANYKLMYSYTDPVTRTTVRVAETKTTPLAAGWNVITRTVLGNVRTFLIYEDHIPPTIEISSAQLTVINQADLDSGAVFLIDGRLTDDSIGRVHISLTVKLNDKRYVSNEHTRADGSKFITVSFAITDFAGNTTLAHFKVNVTTTAKRLKDYYGQNVRSYIDPATTLAAFFPSS